jgi:alpha/beta superfamily hydrolase
VVRRGEYLERAVVVPGADVPIEGLYHHGKRRPGVLIAPPHPERGGAMEGAVVAELAWAITRAGHPTLRFNYRGVGGSGGTYDDAACLDTAAIAAAHLGACCDPEQPGVPIAAAGLGFGATQVARLAVERALPLTHLFLIAPETVPPGIETFDGELVILFGQRDPTDRTPFAALADTVRDGRLTVIPAADAAFLRGLVALGRAVAETLSPSGMIDLGSADSAC